MSRAARYRRALRRELIFLWDDLRRQVEGAHQGCWSAGCEAAADRIVYVTKLVGAVYWGHVGPRLLYNGVFEAVHESAGLPYLPIAWDRVGEVMRSQWTRAALPLGTPLIGGTPVVASIRYGEHEKWGVIEGAPMELLEQWLQLSADYRAVDAQVQAYLRQPAKPRVKIDQ